MKVTLYFYFNSKLFFFDSKLPKGGTMFLDLTIDHEDHMRSTNWWKQLDFADLTYQMC